MIPLNNCKLKRDSYLKNIITPEDRFIFAIYFISSQRKALKSALKINNLHDKRFENKAAGRTLNFGG
jgi:hypothetical protein